MVSPAQTPRAPAPSDASGRCKTRCETQREGTTRTADTEHPPAVHTDGAASGSLWGRHRGPKHPLPPHLEQVLWEPQDPRQHQAELSSVTSTLTATETTQRQQPPPSLRVPSVRTGGALARGRRKPAGWPCQLSAVSGSNLFPGQLEIKEEQRAAESSGC